MKDKKDLRAPILISCFYYGGILLGAGFVIFTMFSGGLPDFTDLKSVRPTSLGTAFLYLIGIVIAIGGWIVAYSLMFGGTFIIIWGVGIFLVWILTGKWEGDYPWNLWKK